MTADIDPSPAPRAWSLPPGLLPGTFEDLRRHHEAEQRLILDALNVMVWCKDDANRIIRCNRAAALWAGRLVSEIEGASVYDLFPPEQARAFHEDDRAVLSAMRPRRDVVVQVLNPDGEKRWLRRDKVPFLDAQGRPGVVILAVDITEHKLAEEALFEADKVRRELLDNVAHQFLTPVAVIRASAETLRSGGLSDTRNRGRFVGIIESHGERLGRLVEQVLDLSSWESGGPLEKAPVELSSLLEGLARNMEPSAAAAGVRIMTGVPVGLVALAHREGLLRVVRIIVDNALAFNRPDGSVWIEARVTAVGAVVEIRDNGLGIAGKALPRIFDPFFKARKEDSSKAGLGLHIAKRIIERHGGRIWVRSILGKGTSLYFSLPNR